MFSNVRELAVIVYSAYRTEPSALFFSFSKGTQKGCPLSAVRSVEEAHFIAHAFLFLFFHSKSFVRSKYFFGWS